MQYAETIHNNQLRVINDALGSGSVFKLFDGECPHRCEDADPGKVLAEIELPLQVFRVADGAKIMLTEPWNGYGLAAAGKGTLARSFRVYSALGECMIQGDCSAPEDGGDLVLDPPTCAAGQKISIGSFTIQSRWS